MNKFIKYLEEKIEGCEMTKAPYRDKIIYQLILDEYKEQLNIGVVGCSLPEIKDLKKHLDNVDNKWYKKNENYRTAYELGASNTFYWMRKEIEK